MWTGSSRGGLQHIPCKYISQGKSIDIFIISVSMYLNFFPGWLRSGVAAKKKAAQQLQAKDLFSRSQTSQPHGCASAPPTDQELNRRPHGWERYYPASRHDRPAGSRNPSGGGGGGHRAEVAWLAPLILLHQEAHRIVDTPDFVVMARDLEECPPFANAAEPVMGEADEVLQLAVAQLLPQSAQAVSATLVRAQLAVRREERIALLTDTTACTSWCMS